MPSRSNSLTKTKKTTQLNRMSSLKPMTEAHRHTINKNRVRMLQSLKLNHELLSILQEDYTLTAALVDEIQSRDTNQAKVSCLLDTLVRRSDKAFDRFVYALVQTGHDHCADQLDPTATRQYIASRKPPALQATDYQQPSNQAMVGGQPWQHYPLNAYHGMVPGMMNSFGSYPITAMNPYQHYPYASVPGWTHPGPTAVPGWPHAGPASTERLATPVQEIDKSQDEKHRRMVADYKAVVECGDAVMTLSDIPPVDPAEAVRIFNSDIIYPMKHKIRGRAIIVSNQFFISPRHEYREGAQFDVVNICSLVQSLGFVAVVYENKTRDELLTLLNQERLEKCRSDHDAFLLFLLTHGNSGCVFTSDGEKVLIDAVTTMFDGNNCPALRGKPKMFFIQACQGRMRSSAYASDGPSRGDSLPVQSTMSIDDTELEKKLTEMGLEDKPGYAPSLPTISNGQHEKADMMIAYATAKGYEAWRQCELGSWFVRSLIYVISREAHSTHLLDMLTKVNFLMAHLETQGTALPYRQVAEKRDTFLKKLYFLPNFSLS